MQVKAGQSRTKILFSDSYLKSLNNLTLQNILEKGVQLDSWIWNIKTNEQVEIMRNPTENLETMESLEKNMQNTNTYKLLETWSEKNKIQTNLSSKPKVEV